MGLYLAICHETNNVKAFTGFEDLKEFAISHKYSHSYYQLGEVQELMDVDLFYYNATNSEHKEEN